MARSVGKWEIMTWLLVITKLILMAKHLIIISVYRINTGFDELMQCICMSCLRIIEI